MHQQWNTRIPLNEILANPIEFQLKLSQHPQKTFFFLHNPPFKKNFQVRLCLNHTHPTPLPNVTGAPRLGATVAEAAPSAGATVEDVAAAGTGAVGRGC